MTYRRLWTEECREASLDGIVDLLEGYHRSRKSHGHHRSGCDDDRDHCDRGYSSYHPLDYLGYLHKISHAYATLPLRLMSQMYGCGPIGRPYRRGRCEDVVVSPRCLCLVADGRAQRFTLQSGDDEEVTLTFDGFKDAADKAVAGLKVYVRDEDGDWTEVTATKPFKIDMDDCDSQNISVKVTGKLKDKDRCVTAKLKVVVDSKTVTRVKLEVRAP